jgi:biopolymer transport protein ExbB
MVALIVQGGVLLIPILLLSLAAVFLIVERALFYWQQRATGTEQPEAVLTLLAHTPASQLAMRLSGERSPQARVIAAVLERGTRLADSDQRRTLDHLVLTEIAALERFVPYLQNIANVATLLGLLGTVVGMIAAFVGMRSAGSTDLTVLSAGIAQALITTAAGLAVAIPSTLCHHLFVNHVQRTVVRLNIAVSEITAHFISDPPTAP